MLPMVREAAKRVVLTLAREDERADIADATLLEVFDDRPDRTIDHDLAAGREMKRDFARVWGMRAAGSSQRGFKPICADPCGRKMHGAIHVALFSGVALFLSEAACSTAGNADAWVLVMKLAATRPSFLALRF